MTDSLIHETLIELLSYCNLYAKTCLKDNYPQKNTRNLQPFSFLCDSQFKYLTLSENLEDSANKFFLNDLSAGKELCCKLESRDHLAGGRNRNTSPLSHPARLTTIPSVGQGVYRGVHVCVCMQTRVWALASPVLAFSSIWATVTSSSSSSS